MPSSRAVCYVAEMSEITSEDWTWQVTLNGLNNIHVTVSLKQQSKLGYGT